jgi:2-polyprenyl-6-methoxyphenol hydroxylase-like FAD-dependent oxidoreductase
MTPSASKRTALIACTGAEDTAGPTSKAGVERERLRGAKREARFAGATLPNFFRKPHGPGWALVGDAGYNKDAITAQGISDAFRDAELCAAALDQTFGGHRSFDEAMADYHATRDRKSRWRCTTSPVSSRRSRHRPSCSRCSARSTAIRARWMASRG